MQTVADRPEALIAIRTKLAAIFVSLELSREPYAVLQSQVCPKESD
jgi:hypothetical protein